MAYNLAYETESSAFAQPEREAKDMQGFFTDTTAEPSK